MFAPLRPRSRSLGLSLLAAAALAGCGTIHDASMRIAGIITPYKVDIVQGNFVSKEQVEALKPGMSRNEVREVLGTPLMSSIFHADRWDYVFTFKRQGVEPQSRKLAVFFRNDVLERFEGDDMPSEAEFVAQLDKRRKSDKVPVLEASEETLKKYPGPAKPAADAAAAPAEDAAATAYPPLEAPTR